MTEGFSEEEKDRVLERFERFKSNNGNPPLFWSGLMSNEVLSLERSTGLTIGKVILRLSWLRKRYDRAIMDMGK